jgi:hypothetical protein
LGGQGFSIDGPFWWYFRWHDPHSVCTFSSESPHIRLLRRWAMWNESSYSCGRCMSVTFPQRWQMRLSRW